jgi:biotin transport system substrate-specific component
MAATLISPPPRTSQGGTPRLSSPMARGLAVLAGSLVLATSAQVAVPGVPVPTTMQSLAVLALGMALGSRLGVASVLLYLAEGASGLPVFANFSGSLAHLAGPTGGYLISFVPAAWLAGRLAEAGWRQGLVRPFLAYALGHGVILATGAAWLAFYIGASQALVLGVVPFIAGSLVKSMLGATIGRAIAPFTRD